jgi:hypothetical protein
MTLGARVLAGVAGATKPYMERQAFGPVTFAAGEMCSFPVLIQPTAPDMLNVIILSNDEFFSSGSGVATATNLDSGTSIKITFRARCRLCLTKTARPHRLSIAPPSPFRKVSFRMGVLFFNSTQTAI